MSEPDEQDPNFRWDDQGIHFGGDAEGSGGFLFAHPDGVTFGGQPVLRDKYQYQTYDKGLGERSEQANNAIPEGAFFPGDKTEYVPAPDMRQPTADPQEGAEPVARRLTGPQKDAREGGGRDVVLGNDRSRSRRD